jgi:hypothetical protein
VYCTAALYFLPAQQVFVKHKVALTLLLVQPLKAHSWGAHGSFKRLTNGNEGQDKKIGGF